MAEPPTKSPSPADGLPAQTSAPASAPAVADPPHDIIEAEDAPSEDDGYETDLYSTASTSISSSVRDYAFENSRRYHKFKEGRYHFPNDEPEQEREDMRHAMLVHLCGGKLHYAPLENPQKILDVGTGTGIWAVDMADEYPDAEVIGVDLSPIQPAWVPPNVRFLVDDAEATWLHQPNSLDYVHLRNMAPAVKDWPKLMDQAFQALKPGGWIEIQDLNWKYTCDDGTMPADYALVQMTTNVRKGLEAFGIQLNAAEKNAERLTAAGFVDIRHKMDKVPVGTWPKAKKMKTIGLYNRSSICDGLHGITMGPLTRGLKWSPEEVEVFLVKVRKDLMNTSIHSYVYFHTFCGQKPLDS